MHHHIRPLAAQLSDEMCNILSVFHVLTGCDYTNPFYRRSKIQSFKKMCLKRTDHFNSVLKNTKS